jgi:hypothetical protein
MKPELHAAKHDHVDFELNTGVDDSYSKELQNTVWLDFGVWGYDKDGYRTFIPWAAMLHATEYPCRCKNEGAPV